MSIGCMRKMVYQCSKVICTTASCNIAACCVEGSFPHLSNSIDMKNLGNKCLRLLKTVIAEDNWKLAIEMKVVYEVNRFIYPLLAESVWLVGILAQNTDEYMNKTFGPTYIVASYIKYIESAGGRVVPIRYPLKHMKTSCSQANGSSVEVVCNIYMSCQQRWLLSRNGPLIWILVLRNCQ